MLSSRISFASRIDSNLKLEVGAFGSTIDLSPEFNVQSTFT
jgi:hypothetical protein